MQFLDKREASVEAQLNEILNLLTKEEIHTWLHHPCTSYIIKKIEFDIIGLMGGWSKGVFTEESESGTLQRNASALGKVSALEGIEDDILSRRFI